MAVLTRQMTGSKRAGSAKKTAAGVYAGDGPSVSYKNDDKHANLPPPSQSPAASPFMSASKTAKRAAKHESNDPELTDDLLALAGSDGTGPTTTSLAPTNASSSYAAAKVPPVANAGSSTTASKGCSSKYKVVASTSTRPKTQMPTATNLHRVAREATGFRIPTGNATPPSEGEAKASLLRGNDLLWFRGIFGTHKRVCSREDFAKWSGTKPTNISHQVRTAIKHYFGKNMKKYQRYLDMKYRRKAGSLSAPAGFTPPLPTSLARVDLTLPRSKPESCESTRQPLARSCRLDMALAIVDFYGTGYPNNGTCLK